MTTDEAITILRTTAEENIFNGKPKSDAQKRLYEAILMGEEALKGEQSYQQTIYKLTEELKMKDESLRGKTTICGHTIPEIIRILDEHDYKTQG